MLRIPSYTSFDEFSLFSKSKEVPKVPKVPVEDFNLRAMSGIIRNFKIFVITVYMLSIP